MDYLDRHPFVRQTVEDKAMGVMIGSALGDSIGLYTGIQPWPAFGKLPDLCFMQNFYPRSHRRKLIQRGSFPCLIR